MTDALFIRDGDLFLPTQAAGGPWSPKHLHGGAPMGLLTSVLEATMAGSGLRLARLTVDLLRPVPKEPLSVQTEVVKPGRRLQLMQASIHANGVEVARASALYLERVQVEVPEYGRFGQTTLPPLDDSRVGTLMDISSRRRSGTRLPPPGLHSTVQGSLIDGVRGRGFGQMWMRLPIPVIAGEPCPHLVQAATLSDFGNGVAQLRIAEDTGCINTDVTLYLHREPVAEWIGLDARSRMQDNGNGLVETVLFDRDGPFGHVLQATVAMKVYSGASA